MICTECGQRFVADDDEEDVCHDCQAEYVREQVGYPDDREDDREPCGSCEWCGTNIYPEDDFYDGELCDACQWHAEQNEGSEDVGGSGIMPLNG